MKTIENLYNEIISSPSKWIYWDGNDNIVDEIKNIIPNFSSMYTEDCGEELIKKLICVSGKRKSTLESNVEKLSNERKRHIISLFFVGHLLYDNIKVIRNAISSQIDVLDFPQSEEDPVDSQKLFSFLWIMLCLFHDLGYAYEEGQIEIKSAPKLEDIYSKLSKEFYPSIYNVNNIKNHDIYRHCKWGVKDHGIWGGREFFIDMSQIKDYLRSKNFKVNKTEVFITEGVDHIYAFAAWIIICHNLRYNCGKDDYSNCFKCQHLDDFIIPKARCISLKSNPLLFLFCLADTLEPTKILKSSKGIQDSMNICKQLELDFSENMMSFNLEKLVDYKAGDEYRKTILSMSDWLIDVNTDLSIAFE